MPEPVTLPIVKIPEPSPPKVDTPVIAPIIPKQPAVPLQHNEENAWHGLLAQLALSGMAQQLAEHCVLESLTDTQVRLWLLSEGSNLQTALSEQTLKQALEQHLGHTVQLSIQVKDFTDETPGQRRVRMVAEKQEHAVQVIEQDEFVRALQEQFGAVIIPGSIRPQP